MNSLKQYITERLEYLKKWEITALEEIDKIPVGTIERTAKWDELREIGFRKSELLMALKNDYQQTQQISKLLNFE